MRRGSVHGLIVDPTWAPPTPALDYGLSPEVKQSTMSSLWSATSHIPFDVWVAASITPGTPSLPKRVDRFAGTRSSVPRPATGPAPPASKTDPMLTEALSTPSLKAAVDELLAALRPTQLALDHREKVITFVQLVLSATLGVKVVPHGSFALRTFLPDSDINLSAFFTRNHDKSWFQRVIRALSSDTTDSVDPFVRGPQHRLHQMAHPTVGVNAASFRTAPDGTRSIRITVNGIPIEIGCNQGHSVAMTAFFEDADRRIGRNHLLKRTLLLAKLWLDNDARVGHVLPSAAISVAVLRVFAAADGKDIDTPLHGMIRALDALHDTDWDHDVFTILGPLPLQHPQNLHVEMLSLAYGSRSPIDAAFLAKHSEDFRVPPDLKKDDDGNLLWMRPAAMNVMDPLDTSANITARVSRADRDDIRHAIGNSLSLLKRELRHWAVLGATGVQPDASDFVRATFHRSVSRYQTLLAMYARLSNKESLSASTPDDSVLQANLPFLQDQVKHAGKFEMPKIGEADLIRLMESILQRNGGTVTVGKMGSLMHEATNNHSLPAMIKARFGGLKKLLKRHDHIFQIASDHPHNPHVSLRPSAQPSRRTSLESEVSTTTSTVSHTLVAYSPSGHHAYPSLSPMASPDKSPSPSSPTSKGSFTLSGDRKTSSADLSPIWDKDDKGAEQQWSVESEKGRAIPSEFICPLTGKIFVDPVTVGERTYERSAVTAKLAAHGTLFRGLRPETLVANDKVKTSIRQFLESSS
ncbi:unnamed protein product (mitochondrion) [Plasmodiophora brassicae]|uniref:U-box domain-containing protein n=1 Tax=Plasmodiophora brassicae TaxID=37360 RepID=A0A3P3Y4P6_PLABS|nr:unnamed protein product [Plasmodiophora brassicae]